MNKNLELKKHVGTIHSSGSISLLQRKIANGLLYNAYNELLTQGEHQISVKDLCILIGYDSNDRKIIKAALIKLLSTVIEWNLIDKDTFDKEGIWNASSIIADASINGPICTYSYSNKMKQLLYHPSIYGRLNMGVQAKFKSSYGLALYENCVRYQNLNSTPWIDFPIFKKLMGVAVSRYVTFAEFKKRVLNIAIKEVNQYAPILINPELKKLQRKVISIRFLISRKPNSQKDKIEHDNNRAKASTTNNIEQQEIYNKLHEKFGMSHNQTLATLTRHKEQYILSKINLIETSPSFLNGRIKNLAKYLLDALEKDYQSPKSSQAVIAKNDNDAYLEKKQHDLEQKLKYGYTKYVRLKIVENFKALKKPQQNSIIDSFLKENKSDVYMTNLYKRKGFLSGYVIVKFAAFVQDKGFELLNGVLSFQDYCAHQANNNISEAEMNPLV